MAGHAAREHGLALDRIGRGAGGQRGSGAQAAEFTVVPDPQVPGGFIVSGERPERWIRQTQFDNDEAVGYLADRLNRLGVEEELVRLGAEPGAPVTLGDVTFDWEPTTPSGDDVPITGRGTDVRLDRSDRIGATERKAARKLRREHHEEWDHATATGNPDEDWDADA